MNLIKIRHFAAILIAIFIVSPVIQSKYFLVILLSFILGIFLCIIVDKIKIFAMPDLIFGTPAQLLGKRIFWSFTIYIVPLMLLVFFINVTVNSSQSRRTKKVIPRNVYYNTPSSNLDSSNESSYEKTQNSNVSETSNNYNSDSNSSTNASINENTEIPELDLEDLNNLKYEVMDNENESAFNKCNKKELRILRNMIYAEKGYIFEDEELSSFFNNKSWYTPEISNQDDIQLDDYDKQFILKLKKYEGLN